MRALEDASTRSALPTGWRRKRRWLIVAAIIILALAEIHLVTRASWDAQMPVNVRIRAVDASTEGPIERASVQALDRDRMVIRNPPTETDANGEATLRVFAAAGGQRSSIFESGSAAADGCRIQCSAPGYATQETAIVEPARFGRLLFFNWGSSAIEVKIPLRRISGSATAR